MYCIGDWLLPRHRRGDCLEIGFQGAVLVHANNNSEAASQVVEEIKRTGGTGTLMLKQIKPVLVCHLAAKWSKNSGTRLGCRR
jgi:hypothetical protein